MWLYVNYGNCYVAFSLFKCASCFDNTGWKHVRDYGRATLYVFSFHYFFQDHLSMHCSGASMRHPANYGGSLLPRNGVSFEKKFVWICCGCIVCCQDVSEPVLVVESCRLSSWNLYTCWQFTCCQASLGEYYYIAMAFPRGVVVVYSLEWVKLLHIISFL